MVTPGNAVAGRGLPFAEMHVYGDSKPLAKIVSSPSMRSVTPSNQAFIGAPEGPFADDRDVLDVDEPIKAMVADGGNGTE